MSLMSNCEKITGALSAKNASLLMSALEEFSREKRTPAEIMHACHALDVIDHDGVHGFKQRLREIETTCPPDLRKQLTTTTTLFRRNLTWVRS
jgi:hypothetical protein